MANQKENPSERLFSNLCSSQYLKGFVFHSPKYNDPTEKEAGDVVLWVRNHLIVFEVVWRNSTSKGNTKQFIKRIGEKRRQLENDFIVYSDKGNKVQLTNEEGNIIEYGKDNFHSENYAGVILVDCDSELENVHYQSYKRTIDAKFPIAVITKKDFTDLLFEINTVSDLLFYLKDRHEFLGKVYCNCPSIFLNLNRRTERDLVALYKRKSNSFNEYCCDQLLENDVWLKYRSDFSTKIDARDKENKRTKVTDYIIDILLKNPQKDEAMPLHAWEMGIKTRRERVLLADKIISSIEGINNKVATRQFAFFNPLTGCWSVFYFQYGEKTDLFSNNLVKVTNLKLVKEIKENGFKYSVFGYGFKKSLIHTGDPFDEIAICIEDAENCNSISTEKYEESLKYFGKFQPKKISEFPI